jgi:two-component system, chemotaxis family, protein-glutamate methylesterase/glutaminase
VGYELVVVGGSLGGFQALKVLLQGLPSDFPLPMAVALHRAAGESADLPALLRPHCSLPIADAEDKESIQPGRVYLAPAGYHLLVERGSLALSTEAPVHFARPSIDALFESAAESYPGSLMGVALTGSSQDGAAGLASITRHGGLAIVQDPTTAESPVLPRAALAATRVDGVVPLEAIATLLVEQSRQSARS